MPSSAAPTPFVVHESGSPLHVTRASLAVGDLTGWTGHGDEQVRARRGALDDPRRRGLAVVDD